MALNQIQKSNIRRHLKYPAIGLLRISPGGGTLASAAAGYRFFDAYGFLEYKMNNLNPDEEARLTGFALGSIAIVNGLAANAGDTVSVTLSGGGLTVPTIITATATQGNGAIDLINKLAAAAALNTTLQLAGFVALTPYGTGPYAQNAVPLPELAFEAPNPFTITTTGSGVMCPQVTSQGNLLPPYASLDGKNTIYGYLPILDGLEAAHGGASQNLDTAKADVWTARGNELGLRWSLYMTWIGKMANHLGIEINPQAKSSDEARRVGAIKYV